MMDIEVISKARAKELGLEIRSHAAGPTVVRVELEIETKGELKSFSRVELEMMDEGKLLASSSMQQERSKSGHVLVGFAVDRDLLKKMTLRVVTQSGPREMSGYDLRVKDFVDLDKVH
jgi:hypothetical protein